MELNNEVCCKKTVIYVTGYQTNSTDPSQAVHFDAAYKRFLEWFNVTEPQFKRIENTSETWDALRPRPLLETLPASGEVISQIQKEVINAIEKCTCDKIHAVVLAHSHGAKCVAQAFRSFQCNAGDVADIYNKTAIFSFGATDHIEKNAAKVTQNYYFTNDTVFFAHHSVNAPGSYNTFPLGPFVRENPESFRCSCCENDKPGGDVTAISDVTGLVAFFEGLKSELPTPSGQPNFAEQTVVRAHYVSDYIECKRLRQNIQEMLSLM